jgi:hypothetical protein
MPRFLHGLNDDISSFMEMFPYKTLQDHIDQAMHTERKIQQEGRGRSYGGRSVSTPWRQSSPIPLLVVFDLKVLQLVLSIHWCCKDNIL